MTEYVSPFTFDFETSIIEVDDGTTDVDCSTLYSAIKTAQSGEVGIIYEGIGSGSGLKELGPGVQVGLTVELLGTWQLRFTAGNYVARVAGGNLTGGPEGDPIAYSEGVQTLLIQSAASTVVATGSGVTAQDKIDIASSVRSALNPDLNVVNDGIKKASLLIPHTQSV
jgi:hypothetical protein